MQLHARSIARIARAATEAETRSTEGLAALVAALAIALQQRAILVVPVAVLESMKRAVGMAAAMVAGRWLFDERISIGRALAVATMAVGAALVLLHAA